MLMDWKDTW